MLQLYKNIKNRRIELGMSQADLAEKAGYADKTAISKIENGLVDLPQSKIARFAEILRTTPGELMGNVDVLSIDPKSAKVKQLTALLDQMDDQQLDMFMTLAKQVLK